MGFFLLAEVLTPNESPEDFARDSTQKETSKDSYPKPGVSSGRREIGRTNDLSSGRIPQPDLATYQRDEEEEEELAEERAEAEEEAREQAEEDEDEALDPEEEEALNEFLPQITPENWRQARAGLLSAYKDGTLPRNPYVEDKFWSKVGYIGFSSADHLHRVDLEPNTETITIFIPGPLGIRKNKRADYKTKI